MIGCLQLGFLPGLSRLGMWRGQVERAWHRVRPSRRRSGAMIEWAIEQSRARGCGLVQLTSDKSRSDALRL